jgi:RNA polymerase sigma factor (sigma-70 family)
VKPVIAAVASTAREEELVARAQAGSSEAFDALFRRYRERITAYVRTIVPDLGRAEDIVQEIFLSALRKLHTLDEPAAFKGWIYEIAKNACVDDIRRVKRNGEVFVRSDDSASFDLYPWRHAQSIHGAVSWKEELTHLKEALGGLPESQHEALVLREVGGMSYDEIGTKMKLSRPAVESILFRARRGLKGEFREITTGARCRRMQTLMAEVAEGMGSLRDRRLLLRHARACGSCRRQATAMGFSGVALPAESGRVRDAISRVASFLPLPFLFNRRPEDSDQVAGGGASFSTQAQGFVYQLSAVGNVGAVSADHATSAIHKAAAVVAAVAVIGGGAGVAVKETGVRLPVLQPKAKQEPTKHPAGPKGSAEEAHGLPAGAGGSSHVPADLKEGSQAGAAPAAAPQDPTAGPDTATPGADTAPTETSPADAGPAATPTSDPPPADPAPLTDPPTGTVIEFDSSGSSDPAATGDTGTPADGGSSGQPADPPPDTGGAPAPEPILLPPPDTPPVDGGLSPTDGQSSGGGAAA